MNKETRQTVFNKYKGKCAYCGTDLIKGWHVDHIKPQVEGGINDIENLNPSCKECNNYKSHSGLELFRRYVFQLCNDKPEYLFKSKTKMQVAINMGAITRTEWDGNFYFERITKEVTNE